ncbi:MAG: 3-hydroxyacyl-[acyl-carrier-protein] dehydratase FabA, partial [Aggregatilineales bacterium]
TNVLHNPAMESDYERFLYLNGWTINQTKPDAAFYTSATYDTIPKPFTSELVAEMVSKSNVSQVDFPRLVDRVYDDGHRVFIELGARQTCTRWIKENLKDRDHLALAFDVPGTSVDLAMMRLVAQLVAHHVPMNLASLYPQPEVTETPPRRKKLSLIDSVVPGGRRIRDEILTDTTIKQFEAVRHMTTTPKSEKQPESASTKPVNYPAYLQQQAQSMEQMQAQINASMQAVAQAAADAATSVINTPAPTDDPMETYPLPVPRQKGDGVIFDEYDMLEFARSGIAGVFGDEYAVIDEYSRRVRLPMPPYLLVSRITRLEAQTNVYEPCSITTEYDIPEDAWYSVDGQVTWAVTTESGQCDLLLISYLGIDFENKGERVYRLLDGTLNFLDELPKNGQRLHYDIDITTFARSGDSLLFFFQYDCYADDKLIMTMRNACAGFFTDEELAMGKGVIRKKQEIDARNQVQKITWTPPITPTKSSISKKSRAKYYSTIGKN